MTECAETLDNQVWPYGFAKRKKRAHWSKDEGFGMARKASTGTRLASQATETIRSCTKSWQEGGHLNLRSFLPFIPSAPAAATHSEGTSHAGIRRLVLRVLQESMCLVSGSIFHCWKIKSTWSVDSQPTQSFWIRTAREEFGVWVCIFFFSL